MTPEPRNVLVIAYYFPPMGLSGVQRIVKFVKYLPEYGWKPTVLTVGPTGYMAYDKSLEEEIQGANIDVIRTPLFFPANLFKPRKTGMMPSERFRKVRQFFGDLIFIPDTKIRWKNVAVKLAMEASKTRKFDLIFATAPPQTDFVIGTKLRNLLQIPLVLDYRDAWYKYPFKYYPTPYHRYMHKRLEKKALTAADHVVVTHRRVKETLIRYFPQVAYKDVTILPHGFDPADIENTPPPVVRRTRMRITHAGTFYINRTPAPLLTALHNVLRTMPELQDKIEIVFIGTKRSEDLSLVKKFGLEKSVTFTGYMEHRDCVATLMDSDVLYLNLGDQYMSPGKIFEYFGTRKPILASIVDGYMKQTLEECDAAFCIPFADTRAHESAIVELYHQYERQTMKQIPVSFSERFNRRILTGELAKIFELRLNIEAKPTLTVKESS
jgi:glycosyltransferase involved in cell wall biosynthesis